MSTTRVSRFAGAIAFLGLGLAAACGGGSGSSGSPGGASDTSAGPSPGLPPSADTQSSDASAERRVVINSTLQVEVEKLQPAYNEVQRIARSAGGYVVDASLSGDASSGAASMRIRVPAPLHDDVVAQVRGIGRRVVRESTNAREVTDEYTDLQSRLHNLQATEAQYKTFLTQARTMDEVLTVSNRLDTVRGQIEQTQGRINVLESVTDFATIGVTLALPAPPAAKATLPGPLEVFADAWHGATQVALVFVNLAAVLAVAVIWLAPASALGIFAWRYGRRLAPVARRIIGS